MSPMLTVSIKAVPSMYKFLNSRVDPPRSMSLSVTGAIRPSEIRICSTAAALTSTNTPCLLLPVSITILFKPSGSAIKGT